jgi:DNA-binding NarL/FixJ family response regulator
MNTPAHNITAATPDTRVRTLVVDDSPLMLRILAEILQEAGKFELIGTASNGCQALRYVSMLSPELVLMDVHMPHLNGIEATRYIKQREHPPAVIIVTSDDSPVTKATAEGAGADGFVSKKGHVRQQLLAAVQKLFGTARAGQDKPTPISFHNPLRDTQKNITAPEEFRLKEAGTESSNPPLAIKEIRATRPATVSSRTNIFGSAQLSRCRRVQVRSSRPGTASHQA